MGYKDDAANFANDLVTMWPEFIPGLVYQWQLEQNLETKNKYYKSLKELYPDHWIVIQI